MDHDRLQATVRQLYALVRDLEAMFPGRPFTPDGHMVGSLGECLVADAYGLELMPPSNQGYDALHPASGTRVEIKATQAQRVAFRSCPEHTIIIRIDEAGGFEEFYNGPGSLIWRTFEGRTRPSNGQFQISLKQVAALARTVPEGDRIARRPRIT